LTIFCKKQKIKLCLNRQFLKRTASAVSSWYGCVINRNWRKQFMSKKFRIIASVMLAGLTLSLAACNGAKSTPTPNAEAVYTQAAQTVQAGLTQTAAVLPSNTPTDTPMPTSTVTPTQEVTQTSAVSPTNTVAPTTSHPTTADKAEWISQNPADGTVVNPNQPFNMVWTVKNTGTTTWNTSYQLRYYLSEANLRFSGSDIKFPKEVKPGETIDLTVPMRAPTSTGDYTTIWVLTNDQGVNFYTVTLTIKVAGAAATNTTAATATTTFTATP
jgi:hypothetical protein